MFDCSSMLTSSSILLIYSGYMAPEYAMHGQFSVKSDVYSFGVLVLEIITGQKNNCSRQRENVEDLLSHVSIILSTAIECIEK